MSRIRKYYDTRFRALGVKLGRTETTFVEDLFRLAEDLAKAHQLNPWLALGVVHADLRQASGETANFPRNFFCDVGLGGLTRWLRGAGYEALWKPGLDDATVIRETQQFHATLITTDSLMMERGVLRDGEVPAIWVPSPLNCDEQLAIVFREMGLSLLGSRCMKCGGALRRVVKEEVANRIPPKTARWLDEYFLCAQCDQLFWRGTHYKKIVVELEKLKTRT